MMPHCFALVFWVLLALGEARERREKKRGRTLCFSRGVAAACDDKPRFCAGQHPNRPSEGGGGHGHAREHQTETAVAVIALVCDQWCVPLSHSHSTRISLPAPHAFRPRRRQISPGHPPKRNREGGGEPWPRGSKPDALPPPSSTTGQASRTSGG